MVSRFQPIILPVLFYEAQMRGRGWGGDTSTSYSVKVCVRKDSPHTHTPYKILELLARFYMQKRMTYWLRNSVFRRTSQFHKRRKKCTYLNTNNKDSNSSIDLPYGSSKNHTRRKLFVRLLRQDQY